MATKEEIDRIWKSAQISLLLLMIKEYESIEINVSEWLEKKLKEIEKQTY